MSRLTIYYGRLSYETGQIPGQTTLVADEFPPLRTAIKEALHVERYGHEWRFGNLDFDDVAGRVTGVLGYPAQEQVLRQDLDDETGDFVQRAYDLPDAATAPFIVDYNDGAFAFDGDAGTSVNGFLKTFLALLETAQRGAFSGELIVVATNYRDFLLRVEKVTKVAFEVRPTNPRDRAIFRPLDVGMKAANATRERVTLENREEGLQIEPPPSRDVETDNPAIQGIEMNDEGYGEGYRIDGERDGQTLRFDSNGGGLLKDVVEEAPNAPVDRIESLRDQFGRRLGFIRSPDVLSRLSEDGDPNAGSGDIEAEDIEPGEDDGALEP